MPGNGYEKLSENFNDSSVEAQKEVTEELCAVERVIEDIVAYVIRREEFLSLEIPLDLDYIPPTTEEVKKNVCTRHCCVRGCVCSSLNHRVKRKKHCKKEGCIFHCNCEKVVYSLRNLPHRKEVKTMLGNKRLRTDSPSTQEVPFVDLSLDDDTSVIPTIEILDDDEEEIVEYNVVPNNIITSFVLSTDSGDKHPMGEIERNLHDFREVFVWCPMHDCYGCNCRGRVFDLQNNLLHNTKTDTAPLKASLHHFFDLEDHCSRTVGSVMNYRSRNNQRIFLLKRDFEIRKGVLSNSNSIFKINPFQSQPKQSSRANVRSATPVNIVSEGDENGGGIRRDNYNQSNSKSLAVKAPKATSPSTIEPKIHLIFHDNSDSSDEESEDKSLLPKYGLLCLNGHGYLPIKEYSSTKLVFQHPLIRNIFVSKRDQEEANVWLNDFLKGWSTTSSSYQWVVVQRGVLKISKLFNIKTFQNQDQKSGPLTVD